MRSGLAMWEDDPLNGLRFALLELDRDETENSWEVATLVWHAHRAIADLNPRIVRVPKIG